MEEIKNDDIIGEIYYNKMENTYLLFENEEHKNICKKIRMIEKNLIKCLGKFEKETFEEYIEYINMRESIEAKNQFKMGFKTAIRIIIESLN